MTGNHRARQLKHRLTRLMPTAVIMGLILLAAFVSSAPSHTVRAQSAPTAVEIDADRQADAAFQSRCSFCHGEHGEGSDVGQTLGIPDLRSLAVQKQTDAALKTILREGKGNMPPFGKSYPDETLDGLIRIVRKLSDTRPLTH